MSYLNATVLQLWAETKICRGFARESQENSSGDGTGTRGFLH